MASSTSIKKVKVSDLIPYANNEQASVKIKDVKNATA